MFSAQPLVKTRLLRARAEGDFCTPPCRDHVTLYYKAPHSQKSLGYFLCGVEEVLSRTLCSVLISSYLFFSWSFSHRLCVFPLGSPVSSDLPVWTGYFKFLHSINVCVCGPATDPSCRTYGPKTEEWYS